MRRIVLSVCLVGAAGAVLWFLPLFRIVSIETRSANRDQAGESAAEFAARFWDAQLAAALPTALDAATVLAALRENAEQAREQFGRSVGLSRSYYYFVRGVGRIVSVDRTAVGVALDDDGAEADVLLLRGLVFGNAVRDATGLLNPSDYKNSQYFNDISSELNRIVEARVLPALDEQAEVGLTIRFVGCAEIGSRADGAVQLKTTPLEIQFE
jgi:predicted lipoprotein